MAKKQLKVLIFDKEGNPFGRMVQTWLLWFGEEFEFEFEYVWPIEPGRIEALARQAWDIVFMDQYPGTEKIVAEFLGHWPGEKSKVINYGMKPLPGTTSVAEAANRLEISKIVAIIRSVLPK